MVRIFKTGFRRAILLSAIALLLCTVALVRFTAAAQTTEPATSGPVLVFDIKGAIGPAASDFVARSLDAARANNAPFVILRIDTPGGLDSSMRVIIRDILASVVPVVCYVAPSGARAASAGTYILYACHVAAMAPGTNLGAATPVRIGGGLPKLPGQDGKDQKDKTDKTQKPAVPGLSDKAINDAVGFIRALAQMRGRNVEWAERAVREAASLSAEDARAKGVIEILANDLPALLQELDGRMVKVKGAERRLASAGVIIERLEPDWRTRLLSVITNPNLAYILLLIGFYGLLFEFYSPGMLLPGVTGAVCLLLGLYALHLLPVNYAGLALIVLGAGLMVAEAFVPSFGVLGLGGATAFVLGSIMLLETDAPGFQISPVLIGSIAAVSSGLFLFVLWMMARAHKHVIVSGREQLIDAPARVLDWSGGQGHVRLHGEVWSARADGKLKPGQQVTVSSIDGLTATVVPVTKDKLS